jgi:hypothetical protein
MYQLSEKLRRLHDGLRGVRHEVLIHSVNAMAAHGLQFGHRPPSFYWAASEAALRSLLAQPSVAAPGWLRHDMASCDLDRRPNPLRHVRACGTERESYGKKQCVSHVKTRIVSRSMQFDRV